MKRTREQRKRERAQTAVMVLALVVLWTVVGAMMVKAWVEEEPINGYEYMEQIGGEFDR